MRTAVALIGMCAVWGSAAQQPSVEPPSRAALLTAIADIEAGHRTTPIIGDPMPSGDLPVTFLAKRDGPRVPRIVSDVTGWGEHVDGTFDFQTGAMARVGRTEWYTLQTLVAPRARIEYLVAYGLKDYRIDPYNPRRADRLDPTSEFVTPGYAPPRELTEPPGPERGVTSEATVESEALRARCRVIVYTPFGYRAGGGYPLAVFLDTRSAQVARVLDWLIARRSIEPLLAAFVDVRSTGEEFRRSGPMQTFLNGELPRWVAARYAVTDQPGRRTLIGISFGARDALEAALSSTAAFNGVGLLIPGRRLTAVDIESFAAQPGRRMRVAILAGQYDRANLSTARHLRRALDGAGHAVHYTEVPEGHSPATWLNNLRMVLVNLFGPRPSPKPLP